MKKLIMLFMLLVLSGCVNNTWENPKQDDSENTDNIVFIQYTF